MRAFHKAFVAPVILTLLSACGGSGGDNGGNPGPVVEPPTEQPQLTPVLSSDNLALYGQLSAITNESVGLVLLSADGSRLSDIQWQQISGPAVSLLAAHTQAVGFDIPAAGNYEFRVTAITQSGQQRQLSFTLTASDDATPEIANVRLDHMATERGRVSLRVDSPTPKIITTVSWEQTAGPPAQPLTQQADTTNGPLQSLFFTAPEVNQDSVLEFVATVQFDDGTTATDKVLVGINNTAVADDGIFTQNDMFVTTDLIAYREDSPYADALRECVYTNQLVNSCTFADLPLIGMQTATPDVDDILDKTLVSHPWMGERFAEFLRQSATSEDMLKLLRGVTAVVISYDIRPSFYWVRTGAIYLDARNFWRTPAERDTLNTAPDYRSDFGNALQFGIYWRYVKNNRYYFPQQSLAASLRNSRDFSKLEASLAWLMYHELAHANDFFPPTAWAGLRDSQTPLDHLRNSPPQSDQLFDTYPLQSAVLNELANVSFGGAEATAAQQSFSATDAADEFSSDIAPAYYAYYTTREDYATLFEQFMMLYRLGVSADIGVVETVSNPQALITWGQRNRINQDTLQARAAFTVERVLPELNVAQLQGTLPSPVQLEPGVSWYDFDALITNGALQRNDLTGDLAGNKSNLFRPPLRLRSLDGHLRY
ncbi:hypothetical protein [Alteromonas gilva]|uniref:Lipoprotein n=1 Tax=Alteromonas gilva TaxID=2987522 RepID=A0ABT5L291_9ALTE|nr:hypothetical protein [Alteromonas gilva]MDC8831169.1 hypothetical protein [Alteromonas gilva]